VEHNVEYRIEFNGWMEEATKNGAFDVGSDGKISFMFSGKQQESRDNG